MNLKKKLKAAQLELMGLKAKIETGDEASIKRAGELTTEIEKLTEQIKTAEKAANLLAQVGKPEGEEDNGAEEAEAKSLGEHFVKSVKKAAVGQRFSVVSSAFKAASDVQTNPTGISQYATDLDRNVVTAPRTALVIRDLFGAETISGNSLTYLVEGKIEGTPAVTAEGAKKPSVHFADPTLKTVSLDKIACHIKESDEYISDYPFLASAINGRLLYHLELVEQNKLVTDLTGTSGIQTDSSTWKAATKAEELADLIFTSMMDVQEGAGFAADAIIMAPKNWQTLRLGKDAESRYYGGGYFADGQGKQLWGIPVVVTTAVTASQIIVGAFKTCGSVVQKGGVSVEATNSNEDDFVKNLMTIRAEERLALAVRRPAGFKLITKAV